MQSEEKVIEAADSMLEMAKSETMPLSMRTSALAISEALLWVLEHPVSTFTQLMAQFKEIGEREAKARKAAEN